MKEAKGSGAFVVAGEGLPVGPLGGQGAVESFDLAVLPGAVRSDERLGGPKLCADSLWECLYAQVLSVITRSMEVKPCSAK